MLYENIKKILEVSKSEGVDVGIAANMIIQNYGDEKNIKKALSKLKTYWVAVTTFNRDGKDDLLYEICNLIEHNRKIRLAKFLNKHEDYIEQSYKAHYVDNK